MSTATNIENAFLTRAAAVTGVAGTYAPEGKTIDKLPAVTMFFIGCPQTPDATGYDIVTWVWGVEIVVKLDDIGKAQSTLQSILPNVMKIVRTDPQLGNTCEWATLEDREEPPFQDEKTNRFIKRIYLRAVTDES